MNWRLIFAIASVGISFGLIACTALTANALEPQRDNSTPSQISERYEGVRLSWDVTRDRSSWRLGLSHSRYCELRVATRRGAGEGHGPPRMALVLGVGY
jgi:hypothetical protein